MNAWLSAGLACDGLHDRPADDVRVGNLALAQQTAMVIDQLAILFDDLDRNDALGSRERDRDARVHVPGNGGGSPAQRLQFFARRGFRA